MEAIYLRGLSNKQDVEQEFDVSLDENVNILLAYYCYENYEGDAYVLFEQDGTLYEVSGGHCSCYGLEGQWRPQEAHLIELKHRVTEGTFGRVYMWNDELGANKFNEELREVIEKLEQK